MRILRDGPSGKYRHGPMPLEICPGRQVWEKHRNRQYLVFVDESFYNFFGFASIDGNFCHAALGVPSENYEKFKALMQPAVVAYRERVNAMTGAAPGEIKSTVLAHLPLDFKLSFISDLVQSLESLGGFVAGFYSTTRGIVMERVRTNLLDEAISVPFAHEELYSVARAELLTEFQGVGQSELIERLLLLPFSALSNFLDSFGCSFRVQYDPRNKIEDEKVQASMVRYMQSLSQVQELFGSGNRCVGIDINTPSHDDLGLQLVDIVAGEVRNFFRRNPEALTNNATLTLVTGESSEPLQYFLEFNNLVHKIGSLSAITHGLATKLGIKNPENPISYFYPVLAAGIWACLTETGQPRLVEIPTQFFLDQRE